MLTKQEAHKTSLRDLLSTYVPHFETLLVV